MSDYTRLIPVPVKAKTEKLLQEKLLKIQLETNKMLNVINIYPVDGWFTAWIYLDAGRVTISSIPKETTDEILEGKQPPKQKRKRKVTKKAK